MKENLTEEIARDRFRRASVKFKVETALHAAVFRGDRVDKRPRVEKELNMSINLTPYNQILVQQVRETAELFGFETRNKYQIMDAQRQPLIFAAEQGKGILGFILRQYLGHWRKFDVHFVTPDRQVLMIAHHPFRWFFERIELRDASGKSIGAIQKRFSILTKRFDLENERGQPIMEVASPIWKIWTFTFTSRGRHVATVSKKWSGLFSEVFTDKDNFAIDFNDPTMGPAERLLVMASSIFIDLLYFEKKAN